MKRTVCILLLAALFCASLCTACTESVPAVSGEPTSQESSDSHSELLNSEDCYSLVSILDLSDDPDASAGEDESEPQESEAVESQDDPSAEPSREQSKEQSKEPSSEQSKEQSEDHGSEQSKETSSDPGKDNSKDSGGDSIDWTPHMNNGFLVVGNRGMEKFGGTAVGGQLTADLLNQFQEAVGPGVQVYAAPVPTAVAFYAPEGYEKSSLCIQDCFYGMRDALVGVKFADFYGAILPHADEEVYARTDHHWFARGAYYAAQELCRVAGVGFATLDTFTEYSREGFIGSVVSAYGVEELRKYPEVFYWYEPNQEYVADYYTQQDQFKFTGSLFSSSKGYTKFIHGDAYCVKIKTGVDNGRKLLVIKDSFGNALAPFLIAGFEEVHMFDIRNFEKNALKYIETYGITDVAFALSAFTVAGTKRNNITRLMKAK